MYLLDTCTLIQLLTDYFELSDKARFAIESADLAYISFASLWEIAIKQGNRKLNLEKSIRQIADICEKTNINILYPTPSELDLVQHLPKIHRDPFDRLIIAQAQSKQLTIITSDTYIPQYNVHTIW